ncbi:fatty acid desaturase family protein [Rhodococcus opacus]|uniref:Putative oxidoreductase n=1 Tax=Rhodococcus opacus (strain B4) TaxID=632772 RepID=C1B5R8_RHOOB|nr:fatty acid desaturase family protein [Rhodococcus opacus]BAH55329.1 putative oxidoreductase [Rhodococcus opacus B4]
MGTERLARYDLTGPEGQKAVEEGLSGGNWFRSAVPRKRMKELMRRSDESATKDTAVWLGSLAVTGAAGALAWSKGKRWAALPALAAYGVLYGSASDARWHESGHGTFFATRWKNDAVYQISSFMMMKDPTVWRWSHTRHHTDTLVVGRDPEIVAMRPARLARIAANMIGLIDVPTAFKQMLTRAAGRLDEEEVTFVPESERPKVYRTARIWLGIYGATAAGCVATGSIVPALLIGLPRAYGASMLWVYSLTQHAGLGENVLDHRLNTRTVYMNRLNRFLYCNMNYHVEHHMFPMIPSHRLAELHEEIKKDCAEPYPSMWAAYKEIIPAILQQLKDQTYYVRRELPEGAAPYNEPTPSPADDRAVAV